MLRSGDQIGPYTLINKLGRGAFGTVWLSERRSTIATTTAALKIPLDDDIDLDAIRHEASLWVKASGHPNILPIIEANIYDEQVIIASEYAPDGSLENWLKQNGGISSSIVAAVDIMFGILAGLEHLHSRSIIHRDLKPANILFQGSTPRLADFGISRVLKSTSQISIVAGTPSYMAPEAFDGKRNEQTDIWSVGVIFYQLLAGRLPFPQSDITSLVGAILSHNPDPLPISVPSPLREIIARALAKDPVRRYKSVVELRTDLRTPMPVSQKVQQVSEPAMSIPAFLTNTISQESLTARPVKQRRGTSLIYVFGALLVALIIGVVTMMWSRSESRKASNELSSPQPASIEVAYEEGDPADIVRNSQKPNPLMLVVKVLNDNRIFLNAESMGALDDTSSLTTRLSKLFQARKDTGAYRPGTTEVETTVWVVTPSSLSKSSFQTIIQAVRASGASPIKVIDEQKYSNAQTKSDPSASNATSPANSNAPVEDTRIFKPDEVDQKARILSKPSPEYTEEARKNQVTGTVVLQMVFSSSGGVTNIKSISGLPFGLTEKAIAAAQRIQFSPAMKDGRTVSQYIRVEYNFNIY